MVIGVHGQLSEQLGIPLFGSSTLTGQGSGQP